MFRCIVCLVLPKANLRYIPDMTPGIPRREEDRKGREGKEWEGEGHNILLGKELAWTVMLSSKRNAGHYHVGLMCIEDSKLFLFFLFSFMYLNVLLACVPRVWSGAHGGQRVSDLLELELQMSASCRVGARKQTLVLC